MSLLSHMARVRRVWGKHCRVKKSPEQKRRLISVLGALLYAVDLILGTTA